MIDVVELCKRLIAFRSLSYRELAIAEFIYDTLRAAGLPCTLDRFDPGSFLAAGAPTPETANVYAELGTGGDALLLYGHVDVVDAADATLFRPRVEDGRLRGRGAADMKSAVAGLMIEAMRRRDAALPEDKRILFAFVADEEKSGTGAQRSLAWLRSLDLRGLHCVLFEPTDDFRLIEVGAKGYAFLELSGALTEVLEALRRLLDRRRDLVARYASADRRFGEPHITPTAIRCHTGEVSGEARVFTGRSCHASTPELGDNSLERCLLELEGPVAAVFTSGNSHNSIPPKTTAYKADSDGDVFCTANVDVRTTPEADVDDGLLSEVESLVSEAGAGLEVRRLKRGRAFSLPRESPILDMCKRAAGHPVREIVARGGSDAVYYARITPSVVGGFGPGQRSLLHTENESIDLAALRSVPRIVDDLILEFLEGPRR